MIAVDGIASLALLFLWIYAIVDVISTAPASMRNLPKPLWLVLVVVLPDVGSIAWLVFGRPKDKSFVPGPGRTRPSSRPASRRETAMTEDSPAFMDAIEQGRLRAWEENLRKREEELRRREGGSD